MTRRTLLVVALAMGLAALTSWLSREYTREDKAAELAQRHVADYFLTGFTATTLDAAGDPEYRLSAERLVHYTDTETMELTRPQMVLFGNGEDNWRADAAAGWIGPGGELVRLEGGVVVYRGDSPEKARTRLVTDTLRIRPKEEYAETDAPVTITRPGTLLEAKGMQAYLADDRLVLLSDVRGTHEPPAR